MKQAIVAALVAVVLGHTGAGDHIHGGAGSKPVVMTTPIKGK
jgi:hypothetical protein